MSLVIELPTAQEAQLREEARRAGVTVSEWIARALAERFAPNPEEDAKALALVQSWLAEAPTDPTARRAAEADLRDFQRAANRTRRAVGARLPYPTVAGTGNA